jgi:hypothetical protein
LRGLDAAVFVGFPSFSCSKLEEDVAGDFSPFDSLESEPEDKFDSRAASARPSPEG